MTYFSFKSENQFSDARITNVPSYSIQQYSTDALASKRKLAHYILSINYYRPIIHVQLYASQAYIDYPIQ